jgi:hypothetical protein
MKGSCVSDSILKLIPVDPYFVPEYAARLEALDLLSSWFPAADVVSGAATDEVNFVDPGANLARVVCPACGRELDLEHWQQFMDAAYATQFADLTVTMPCCGAMGSLNDLHYEAPAGFARFELEVLNPNGNIADEQCYQLEQILGCALRKIWAEY